MKLAIPFSIAPLAGALSAALLISGCTTPNYKDAEKFDAVAEQSQIDAQLRPVKLNTRAVSVSKPKSDSDRIGPGDRLNIAILGRPESRTSCVVLPDGMVYYDIAGGVKVSGLTVGQVEKKISDALTATNEYRTPVVIADLAATGSQRFTILGQVGTPGSFPSRGAVTLLDAIASAGGISPSADLGRAMVVRGNSTIPADIEALVERGDMSQNIYITSGDYLFVPAAGLEKVNVLGSVNRPGPVPYSSKLTIVSALAAAGGPSTSAASGKVAIIRGSLQTPKVAVIDFKDITKGKAANFRIAPNDIIWVPQSPWTRVEEYVMLAFRSAASTGAVRLAEELYGNDDDFSRTGTSVDVPQTN